MRAQQTPPVPHAAIQRPRISAAMMLRYIVYGAAYAAVLGAIYGACEISASALNLRGAPFYRESWQLLIRNGALLLGASLIPMAVFGLWGIRLRSREKTNDDALPRIICLYAALGALTVWTFLYAGLALGPALWSWDVNNLLPGNPAVQAFLEVSDFLGEKHWYYRILIADSQQRSLVLIPVWLSLYFVAGRHQQVSEVQRTVRRCLVYGAATYLLFFTLPSAQNILEGILEWAFDMVARPMGFLFDTREGRRLDDDAAWMLIGAIMLCVLLWRTTPQDANSLMRRVFLSSLAASGAGLIALSCWDSTHILIDGVMGHDVRPGTLWNLRTIAGPFSRIIVGLVLIGGGTSALRIDAEHRLQAEFSPIPWKIAVLKSLSAVGIAILVLSTILVGLFSYHLTEEIVMWETTRSWEGSLFPTWYYTERLKTSFGPAALGLYIWYAFRLLYLHHPDKQQEELLVPS